MNFKLLKGEIEKNKKDIQIFLVSVLMLLCYVGWFVAPMITNITDGINEIGTEDYDEMNTTEKLDYGTSGYELALLSIYTHFLWVTLILLVLACYWIPTTMFSLFSDNTKDAKIKRIEREIELLKRRK